MGSLLAVARDRGSYDDLWQLAEDLLTHDETAALWRMRHVQMVERQIGTKSGTGGSTGAPTFAVGHACTTFRCFGNLEPGYEQIWQTLTKE
ncbi:tryptophan 2,3-dioxygenase family protein [Nonomuraea antimicrobica]